MSTLKYIHIWLRWQRQPMLPLFIFTVNLQLLPERDGISFPLFVTCFGQENVADRTPCQFWAQAFEVCTLLHSFGLPSPPWKQAEASLLDRARGPEPVLQLMANRWLCGWGHPTPAKPQTTRSGTRASQVRSAEPGLGQQAHKLTPDSQAKMQCLLFMLLKFCDYTTGATVTWYNDVPTST